MDGPFPSFFNDMNKELSIFIDESGDYGILGDKLVNLKHKKQEELYVISFVFHDQQIDISNQIDFQNKKNEYFGFDVTKPLHFAPLLRGDDDFYKSFTNDEKLSIYMSESYFINHIDISCAIITIDKTSVQSADEFKSKFVTAINSLYSSCSKYFDSFDQFKIYYDDGQGLVRKILNECDFCNKKPYVAKRKFEVANYQLFGLCDYLCTIELIKYKRKNNCSSSNELALFSNQDTFKKRIIKTINNNLVINKHGN